MDIVSQTENTLLWFSQAFYCQILIVSCAPTSNGKYLTDVDPEQAEAACANKAQSLQVQQGGCVLEAFQPSQLLHTQNQGGPAPVKDTQQRLKTLLQRQS